MTLWNSKERSNRQPVKGEVVKITKVPSIVIPSATLSNVQTTKGGTYFGHFAVIDSPWTTRWKVGLLIVQSINSPLTVTVPPPARLRWYPAQRRVTERVDPWRVDP
jgi:hypothetical protein